MKHRYQTIQRFIFLIVITAFIHHHKLIDKDGVEYASSLVTPSTHKAELSDVDRNSVTSLNSGRKLSTQNKIDFVKGPACSGNIHTINTCL